MGPGRARAGLTVDDDRRSPTVADLAGYSEPVSAAVQLVRDHRNTSIAHRSQEPKPAKFVDIRNAFGELDGPLHDLNLVAAAGTGMSMTLGEA